MIAYYMRKGCQPLFPTETCRAQLSDERFPSGYPPLQARANFLAVALRSAFRRSTERNEGRAIVALDEPPPPICKTTAIYLKLGFRSQSADFLWSLRVPGIDVACLQEHMPCAFRYLRL
jgi:hypothetical protein